MQLPGEYETPRGALLMMLGEARVAGCAALRPAGDGVGELRRVYVRPEERGLGYGRALVEAIMARARRAGYREVRLETLDAMNEAIALYESLGFVQIAYADGVRTYAAALA